MNEAFANQLLAALQRQRDTALNAAAQNEAQLVLATQELKATQEKLAEAEAKLAQPQPAA